MSAQRADEPAPAEEADEHAQVARARDDPRAFEPLYVRYFDPVYRYCYRRLRDPEAAADVTSQVFARALAALPRYCEGSFRSWLFAIAHNALADHARRRRGRTTVPLDEALWLDDPDPGPEAQAVAGEGQETLAVLLASLPAEQRLVVELRLAGLTGVEIGAVLGRSLPAVKSLQFRAYANLRKLLRPPSSATEPSDATS